MANGIIGLPMWPDVGESETTVCLNFTCTIGLGTFPYLTAIYSVPELESGFDMSSEI
jgi:hypothetical protein